MSAETRLAERPAMRAPRFDRCLIGDEVLLGVAAVVDPVQPRLVSVVISGDLCPASAPTLGDMLDAVIDDGVTEIHVDLSKVDLCTSHGVDVLEHARRRMQDRDGGFHLAGARGVVRRVLDVTGLEAGGGEYEQQH